MSGSSWLKLGEISEVLDGRGFQPSGYAVAESTNDVLEQQTWNVRRPRGGRKHRKVERICGVVAIRVDPQVQEKQEGFVAVTTAPEGTDPRKSVAYAKKDSRWWREQQAQFSRANERSRRMFADFL